MENLADGDLETEVEMPMWRRQCARNLMDCYAAGMNALSRRWKRGEPGHKALEALTRLMVDGMTAVKTQEDERSFYRMAAASCRECAEFCGPGQSGPFRIYAAVFEDMAVREGI
jgi:hypothetical protein